MKQYNKVIVYHCGFCEFEFPLFKAFPEGIIPYCPNCSNDEDVLPKDTLEI